MFRPLSIFKIVACLALLTYGGVSYSYEPTWAFKPKTSYLTVYGQSFYADTRAEACGIAGGSYVFQETTYRHYCGLPKNDGGTYSEIMDNSTTWTPVYPSNAPDCGPTQRYDPYEYVCVEQSCPVEEGQPEQIYDYVAKQCVLKDGEPDGGLEPSDPECDSLESCLALGNNQCSGIGKELIEFQYFGGSQYGTRCGDLTAECPSGYVFNLRLQACITDYDSDGTPDPFDPEPEDPLITGDSDGDTIPDAQDEYPEDPEQWLGSGGGFAGQPITVGNSAVDPVGESPNFNDTAIVSAINENTKATNSTNTLLDAVNDTQKASNNLLSGIEGKLSGINDTLQPVDPDETNNTIADLITQDASELGLHEVTDSDSDFVNTMFGKLSQSSCVNPSFDGKTIDLCSLAPRILPLAEFIIYCLTLMFIYSEFHAVIRRREA